MSKRVSNKRKNRCRKTVARSRVRYGWRKQRAMARMAEVQNNADTDS